MVVRYLIAMLALTAALALLPQASAQLAPYDQMEFTEVISDAADFPANGFADARSLAIGEPGDDSVIFRYEPNSLSDSTGQASAHMWFDAPAGSFRSGINSDGTPGSSNPSDACEIVDPYVYCQMSYGTLGGGVGSTIAAPYIISYVGLAQDRAPGGVFWEHWVTGGPVGDDYTLVGSTLISSGGDDVTEEITETYEVIEETIEGETAEISLSIDEPSEDVYVYNWSNDLEAALLSGEIVVEEGSVVLYIEDGEGTVLLEEEFSGDVSLDESFDVVGPGAWTIALELYGFVGSADLLVEAQAEDDTVDDGTTSDASGNATADGSSDGNGTADPADVDQAASGKESPGAGILVLVGVVAVALLRRR